MLIAYNNDIEFNSRMYHIQTEDNGIKDGHITTTVFHSGRTLDSKTTSYKKAIEGVTDVEEQNKIIKGMMIEQHKQFYAKLFDGQYEDRVDPDKKPLSGEQPGLHRQSGSQVLNPSGMTQELQQPGGFKTGKPDILRASQQASGVARPGGVKPFSGLSPIGFSPRQSPSQVPISAGLSGAASNAQRQPGVKPKLSKAVEKANLTKKRRTFCGVKWSNDDLAIDALVALLLDSN